MKEKTLEEIIELIGEAHCPVILKSESEPLEAAVCLKKTPSGYMLGISDKLNDLKLFFGANLQEAKEKYLYHHKIMQQTGSPFKTND